MAPDLAQHLRRTYDRLAVQHGWPALADAAALPEDSAAAAARVASAGAANVPTGTSR